MRKTLNLDLVEESSVQNDLMLKSSKKKNYVFSVQDRTGGSRAARRSKVVAGRSAWYGSGPASRTLFQFMKLSKVGGS